MPSAVVETLIAFLRLGLTAFGGPVAHLSYFRAEFVECRKWVGEAAYADIIALCQFLPGPASSQVAIILGLARAGWLGAAAAWIGFTLPSALLLALFALGVASLGAPPGAAHGLKIVAVAVVAQAVWSMAKTLCPDPARASLAVASAALALGFPSTLTQLTIIAAGAIFGWRLIAVDATQPHAPLPLPQIPRQAAFVALALFAALLVGLPTYAGGHALRLFEIFFRSGALVFGGGHVVLPLLQQAIVPHGYITNDAFLAGYGAAQAVPGPLFAFAAYLGAAMWPEPNGLVGAALCLFAIYLPSFLLLAGVLPFWEELRRKRAMQAALKGVNAAVVGLLGAALYAPVFTSAIFAPLDLAAALVAYLLLVFWKAPPFAVVALGALAGALLPLATG